MIWSAFKTAVENFMPGDAMRQNCADMIELQTRVAVRHLQRLIPFYQEGHITYFAYTDGTLTGSYAMSFVYPDSMVKPRPKELWVVTTVDSDPDYAYAAGEYCERAYADDYPWKDRWDMRCCPPNKYAVSWDTKGGGFWLFPALEEGYMAELHWDGLYSGWADDDECGMDEDEADAVADYIRSQIRMEVDRDPAAAAAFMTSWRNKVRRLHVDAVRRTNQTTQK